MNACTHSSNGRNRRQTVLRHFTQLVTGLPSKKLCMNDRQFNFQVLYSLSSYIYSEYPEVLSDSPQRSLIIYLTSFFFKKIGDKC